MKKKLLLFFSMLVVALNAGAWSNGQYFTANGFTFIILDADLRTVKISATEASTVVDGCVTFPATVADPRDPNMFFTVTQVQTINWNDSQLRGNPTSAVIPEGYTSVCLRNTNIKTLTLPSTLTSIDFYPNCTSFQNFIFPNGNSTFKFDAELGAFMSIDGKNYYYHDKSKTPDNGILEIPEGVTYVAYTALYEDSKIKTIHIPSTLVDFHTGGDMYITGGNHTSFTIADGNPNLKVVDGVLYKKRSDGKYELRYYPRGKTETTYVVPEDVVSIGQRAFQNHNVTDLVLHDNITTIYYLGLSGNGVTSITVPAALTNLSGSTFAGFPNVANITIPDSHPKYKSIDGVVFTKDGKQLVFCPVGKTGDYEIPAGVTAINSESFRGTHLTNIKANAELVTVGNSSLVRSSYLKNVDFSAVTGNLTIGVSAFYSTPAMTSITLPASTVSIQNNAFQETGATKLIIPDGSKIQTIGSSILGYSKIKEVEFQGSCDLTAVGSAAFANAYYLESMVLPSNVKTLGDRAFLGCRSLTSVTLPESLEEIGSAVFDGCTSLNEIIFPANSKLKTIKRNAFDGAPITSLTLTEGVEKIEAEAFIGCDALTSINIPASLTDLSPEAFKFCNNLTAINVAEDNPVYASVDGILMSKDLKTVLSFPAGKANMSTLLPPTVEKIGDYAFYANDQLTNITLPAKVTEIGERAFGLCSNLNSITFLGSTKMPSSGISTAANKNAFDDGAADNITLNVRAAVQTAYESDPFYSTFDGVTPSSKVGHEEYIPMSETAAMLLSTDATDKVYKVPSTIGGYSVANIGDNAFDTTSGIEEVIVPATVTDLGFQAFKNSSVNSIYFLGDAVKVATEKYNYPATDNEFNANQKVYVKRSQLDAAQTNMPRFANQITNEVPYAAPTADFGTFSREFATDFSNGGTNTVASPKFIAFNTISGKETKGDTDVFIIESINAGGADGTYIPANTGVIFKKYGTAPTYYEIADNQTASPVATFVVPVLEETTVSPGVGVQHYYIGKSDGKAHLITSAITIGAHKAYLKVTASSPAKKVAFRFIGDSDDSATGINEVETASEKSEAIYNLNGQRVNGSVRGIVIRGGKKYINQ